MHNGLDASKCTAVTCAAAHVDEDGDASTGSEAVCPSVADGTCTTCSYACPRAAVTSNAAHVDEVATRGPAARQSAQRCRRHMHYVLARLPARGGNEQR